MGFSKNGYMLQIGLMLGRKDYARAYEVAAELAGKAPGMQQDYLLAVCAFWTGRYKEAYERGRSALSVSGNRRDRISCTLLCASALYRMKEYRKGYELLASSRDLGFNDRIEEMMVYLSLAMGDERDAIKHARNLFALNRELAIRLMERIGSR